MIISFFSFLRWLFAALIACRCARSSETYRVVETPSVATSARRRHPSEEKSGSDRIDLFQKKPKGRKRTIQENQLGPSPCHFKKTASSSSLYTFRRLGPRSEMSRFSEVGSMAPHGGRKLLKFLILFENSSLLFFPGQFLSGRVLVELEDETPVLGESPFYLNHFFFLRNCWTIVWSTISETNLFILIRTLSIDIS